MVVKALYVGIITCKQLFRFEVRFVCLEFYKNCPRLSEMVDHYQCVLRATRCFSGFIPSYITFRDVDSRTYTSPAENFLYRMNFLLDSVKSKTCMTLVCRISALCGQLEESPSNTTGVYLQHQFFLEVAFFLPQS